jgi:hypothetical protein
LSGAVMSVKRVMKAYPELKTNPNMLALNYFK